jgi:membrane protein DedA with SNARE-associated domain
MTLQDLQSTIHDYGYYAVLAGAIVEGETILLIAAISASQGLLDLKWVIALSTLSATTGDNLYFWLGRLQGKFILRYMPQFEPRLIRFNRILERWHTPAILSLRFLYGLRIVGPMAVGMSGFKPLHFLCIDVLGSLIWALLFSYLGFAFGQQILPYFISG